MFQCRTISTNHIRHITTFQNRCYFQRRFGLRSITRDFNWASNELVDM